MKKNWQEEGFARCWECKFQTLINSHRLSIHTTLSYTFGVIGKASSGMCHQDSDGCLVLVGFHLVLNIYNSLCSPKGCVMDLWNFCKVWTLKNRPKALLLICFYCGGGTNEAHVCTATFHCPAFSCVMGVRGCTGDMWVTGHNSGEEISSWQRSSGAARF